MCSTSIYKQVEREKMNIDDPRAAKDFNADVYIVLVAKYGQTWLLIWYGRFLLLR